MGSSLLLRCSPGANRGSDRLRTDASAFVELGACARTAGLAHEPRATRLDQVAAQIQQPAESVRCSLGIQSPGQLLSHKLSHAQMTSLSESKRALLTQYLRGSV